jgi:hypothetical protein
MPPSQQGHLNSCNTAIVRHSLLDNHYRLIDRKAVLYGIGGKAPNGNAEAQSDSRRKCIGVLSHCGWVPVHLPCRGRQAYASVAAFCASGKENLP